MESKRRRIIIGISGASGVIYGIKLLEILQKFKEIETHLIISPAACLNINIETDYQLEDVLKLADIIHDFDNLAAAVSSGSFVSEGMIIVPCSIKSLSAIVNSFNDNLLVRAADVMLKEKRKLIVVPRETPLHKGHLELMLKLTDYGGILLPPCPAFYHKPQTIEDIINQTLGKILDQFQLEHSLFQRWGGSTKEI